MRTVFIGGICLLLSGCVTQKQYLCLPQKVYDVQTQQSLAAELEKLPPNSLIQQFITDYGNYRSQYRAACSAIHP